MNVLLPPKTCSLLANDTRLALRVLWSFGGLADLGTWVTPFNPTLETLVGFVLWRLFIPDQNKCMIVQTKVYSTIGYSLDSTTNF